VQHPGGLPNLRRVAELLIGLAVPGDQHRRNRDLREHAEDCLEPLVPDRKIAGADHHIDLFRLPDQTRGGLQIAVQIAE